MPKEPLWDRSEAPGPKSFSRNGLPKRGLMVAACWALLAGIAVFFLRIHAKDGTRPIERTVMGKEPMGIPRSSGILQAKQLDLPLPSKSGGASRTHSVKKNKRRTTLASTSPESRAESEAIKLIGISKSYSRAIASKVDQLERIPIVPDGRTLVKPFEQALAAVRQDELEALSKAGEGKAEVLKQFYREELSVLNKMQREIQKINTRAQQAEGPHWAAGNTTYIKF